MTDRPHHTMQNGQITKSAVTLCLFHITINRCIYRITTLSTLSPLLFQEQPYTLASITHPKIRLALLFTKPKQKPMATQNHTGAEAKQISTGAAGYLVSVSGCLARVWVCARVFFGLALDVLSQSWGFIHWYVVLRSRFWNRVRATGREFKHLLADLI